MKPFKFALAMTTMAAAFGFLLAPAALNAGETGRPKTAAPGAVVLIAGEVAPDSFADICNRIVSNPYALADSTASACPLPGASTAPFAAAGSDGPAPAAGAAPAPPDWLLLCGFALMTSIARRRRNWLEPRGYPLGPAIPPPSAAGAT